MIVKLKVAAPDYHDLSRDQPYFVIGIEADDYRILNDEGKPYLYAASSFDVMDPGEPKDWITEYGEDGERYSYPEPLHRTGFFEDYFEDKQEQTATFWHVVNQRLTRAA